MFEELEEMATDVLLAMRNAIQYGRLVVFLRNRRLNVQQEGLDVDFDSLYVPEEDAQEHEVETMLQTNDKQEHLESMA